MTPLGQVWLPVKSPSEIIIFIIREFAERAPASCKKRTLWRKVTGYFYFTLEKFPRPSSLAGVVVRGTNDTPGSSSPMITTPAFFTVEKIARTTSVSRFLFFRHGRNVFCLTISECHAGEQMFRTERRKGCLEE